MKKRKLWIYGCSYSDYWGDEKHRFENAWPALLAKELDLSLTHQRQGHQYNGWMEEIIPEECTTTWRAMAGEGFSAHRDIIFEDIHSWQPQDIVIIEESVRVRCFTPYLKMAEDFTREAQQLIHEDIVPHFESNIRRPKENRALEVLQPNNIGKEVLTKFNEGENIEDWLLYRQLINWKMWYNTIRYIVKTRPTNTFLWNFSDYSVDNFYRVQHGNTTPEIQPYDTPMLDGSYSEGVWKLPHWDDYVKECGENILRFPWGKTSYERFIGTHPSLFFDYKEKDDHQSNLAHKIQAEYFGEQIKTKMK